MSGPEFMLIYFLLNFITLCIYLPRFPMAIHAIRYSGQLRDIDVTDSQLKFVLIITFMLAGFPIVLVRFLLNKSSRF